MATSNPDRHVLAPIESKRCRFLSARRSSKRCRRAITYGPIPSFAANAAIQTRRILILHIYTMIRLNVARCFDRSYFATPSFVSRMERLLLLLSLLQTMIENTLANQSSHPTSSITTASKRFFFYLSLVVVNRPQYRSVYYLEPSHVNIQ